MTSGLLRFCVLSAAWKALDSACHYTGQRPEGERRWRVLSVCRLDCDFLYVRVPAGAGGTPPLSPIVSCTSKYTATITMVSGRSAWPCIPRQEDAHPNQTMQIPGAPSHARNPPRNLLSLLPIHHLSSRLHLPRAAHRLKLPLLCHATLTSLSLAMRSAEVPIVSSSSPLSSVLSKAAVCLPQGPGCCCAPLSLSPLPAPLLPIASQTKGKTLEEMCDLFDEHAASKAPILDTVCFCWGASTMYRCRDPAGGFCAFDQYPLCNLSRALQRRRPESHFPCISDLCERLYSHKPLRPRGHRARVGRWECCPQMTGRQQGTGPGIQMSFADVIPDSQQHCTIVISYSLRHSHAVWGGEGAPTYVS